MLSQRRAFALVELLIAITLTLLVLGTIVGVVVRQLRVYAGVSDMLDTRNDVREAADALTADLRGISPAAGDIYAMSASAIEFRVPSGAAIVCTISPTRTLVTIPPLVLAAHNGATWWPSEPEAGDSLWIFDPGPLASSVDDQWRVFSLTAAPSAGTCPVASGFTASPSEAGASFSLALDHPLPATIPPGAAIRFFRRAKYELYQASDNRWYLGYIDCLSSRTTPCAVVQPVSGPYLPAASAPPGLSLSYFNVSGASTVSRTSVARIDVVVRADSKSAVRIEGMSGALRRDSMLVSIHPRN